MFRRLVAIHTPTEDDPEHVTIRPRMKEDLVTWAESRDISGSGHVLTEEIQEAVLDIDKP